MESKRCIIWAAVSTRPQADEDERFSIPQQISDAERLCRQKNWQVLDVLKVPGHSRSYRTLDAVAADARRRGIDAFDRLIDHFNRKDFDIFICRDANRFARKPSLLHYIVETIIEDCAANIYSLSDAFWVNNDNMDMWATMQGYKVRAEVKWLIDARNRGLLMRAQRGLSTGRLPFSHILRRDERGEPVEVIVDESKRRLFDDLAYLIVEEQTPYNGIERILYERFGHVADDGNPYGNHVMYKFLYNPLTWGTTAYGYSRAKSERRFGLWVFDESEPVPDGATVYRDMIEPVYSGHQAERLKAELRRRKQMLGRRRPKKTHAFSGLLICGMCDYTLGLYSRPNGDGSRTPLGYWCNTSNSKSQYAPFCDQTKSVPVDYLQSFVDQVLHDLLESGDLSAVTPEYQAMDDQVDRVTAEIAQLNATLDNLIRLQATAAQSTQQAYQRQIDSAGERIAILERRAAELRGIASRQAGQLKRSRAALDDIRQIIDTFWAQEPATINQYLHRLLGSNRFVVLGGQVIGIRPAPERKRRKPR